MKIEDEVNAMFPMQREAIARATLAGCRFEPRQGIRRNVGGQRWQAGTVYEAYLPDGTFINPPRSSEGFGDVYEAALACLTFLDHKDNGSMSVAEDGSFVLRPENEQERSRQRRKR